MRADLTTAAKEVAQQVEWSFPFTRITNTRRRNRAAVRSGAGRWSHRPFGRRNSRRQAWNAWQICHRTALVRGIHHRFPDFGGNLAPRCLLGRGIVVIAEPDSRCHVAGVANKPRIAERLTGAGFAAGRAAICRAWPCCPVPVSSVSDIIRFMLPTSRLCNDASAVRRRTFE